MVGSCWCWSRSSSLDNNKKTRSEIFGQTRFGSFSKLNLICLFHPILGEFFHFDWYVATGYYRKRTDAFGVLGKPMIVLSLFYFQMKFKIGIFLFTLLGTITYPLPRHIWSWRVPRRVNPSPKWKFLQPQEKLRITFPLKLNPADVDSRESRLDIILCPVWYVFLVYPLPSNSDNQDLVDFFC